jgi:hypothetical protein
VLGIAETLILIRDEPLEEPAFDPVFRTDPLPEIVCVTELLRLKGIVLGIGLTLIRAVDDLVIVTDLVRLFVIDRVTLTVKLGDRLIVGDNVAETLLHLEPVFVTEIVGETQ